MSPFHSLRRKARACGIRTLAGLAVFGTLAIGLTAATAAGPLANAEATETGAPAQGADPALSPEPVLGAEQATPVPPAAEPEQATAPEPAAVPEPAAASEPAAVPEPAAAPEPATVTERAPSDAAEPPPAAAEEPAEQSAEEEPALGGKPPADDATEEPPRDEGSQRREQPSGEQPGGEQPGAEQPGGEEPSGDEPSGDESSGEESRGGAERGEERAEEPPSGELELGEDPAQRGVGEGSAGRWWRGDGGPRLRIPNLTGAIGSLGGGGKDEDGASGPGLNSPIGGSQVVRAAPPQPPSDELPELPADLVALVQSPPAAAPEPAPGGSRPGPQVEGRSMPASAPVDTLDGGSSSGTGSTGAAGIGGGRDAAGTTPGGTGAGVTDEFVPAPAANAGPFTDPIGQGVAGSDGSANPGDFRGPENEAPEGGTPPIFRPVERAVNQVPDALKYALAALAALSIMLGIGYLLATMRARSLGRQRRELLQEVGLLQSALLPPVPEKLGSLRTSVAYRPADGPGAGGDFYDVLPLAGGSVGFILGDVSGHGRGALARTAFMRYTLRAYLEAGLEPRAALQVAGRVIDENLGGDFATVLLAVHDPETGSLTYATAGHPAPIVVGPETHHPVTAGSSPPIGVGVPTGLRQTTVPLVPGAVACLFTDGLMDARVAGGILGRSRLEELLRELGDDASARELIERVSQESRVLSDDIAAVVVSPTNGVAPAQFRTEQLELTGRELEGPIAHRFLESCGVSPAEADAAVAKARALTGGSGAVILDVVFADNLQVDVRPRDADSIEAASRRASAA